MDTAPERGLLFWGIKKTHMDRVFQYGWHERAGTRHRTRAMKPTTETTTETITATTVPGTPCTNLLGSSKLASFLADDYEIPDDFLNFDESSD